MVLFQLSRQYVGVLSQTVFRDRLGGSQQTVPQLIMDMHFGGENLFIQIDFHDTVQQGFLPLLRLAAVGWCSRTVLR